MCGRYILSSPIDVLQTVFGVVDGDLLEGTHPIARYNIAPLQPIVVVRQNPTRDSEQRTADHLQWGLVPPWAKDTAMASHTINARAETLRDKPSFMHAFRRRRCLIPTNGYYEWGTPSKQSKKAPYFVHAQGRALLAFAGLWEIWQAPDGGELQSCTIITTEANDTLKPLHARMPVILPRHQWDLWLDPRFDIIDELQPLLQPLPDDALEYHRVSHAVGNIRNDDASLIDEEREQTQGTLW